MSKLNNTFAKFVALLFVVSPFLIACNADDEIKKLNDSKLGDAGVAEVFDEVSKCEDKGKTETWMTVINNKELGDKRRIMTMMKFADMCMEDADLATMLEDPTVRKWFESARIASRNGGKLPEGLDRTKTVLIICPELCRGKSSMYVQLDKMVKWDEIFSAKPGDIKIDEIVWYPPMKMEMDKPDSMKK